MADEEHRYLTVSEAAGRLRTSPQTVYRWCRSGRLRALKVGKEWRIPAEELGRDAKLAGLQPLDTLLARLHGRSEHLLGLASDEIALGHMEATFFNVASPHDEQLIHARWDESVGAVRRRLRSIVSIEKNSGAQLRNLDIKEAYENGGVKQAVQLLLRAVERASSGGMRSYAFGSPYAYFAYNVGGLVELEAAMDASLRDKPAVVLCGHALSGIVSLYGVRALAVLMDLADCHTGVIYYDGQRALLERSST